MIAEAVQRTGFARTVRHHDAPLDDAPLETDAARRAEKMQVGTNLKPGESMAVTLPDVRAASACRLHARSKTHVPRPHRDVWITLIRSALPDGACFASPHPLDEMFAPPPMTQVAGVRVLFAVLRGGAVSL
jgi:hypothetical protein